MASTINTSVETHLAKGHGGPWAPFKEPLFRSLWVAAVISYTGTWMRNVGAGWLMTQLTTSPFMVSLVQAASTLPVFLVILPAGALADMVDRRRFLLIT
ncbi:MAG TPA: MFS transporter, partial [Terriglobales bacterium]|nr:MFS transporter [Terriglobales bacterium]